MGDTYSDFVKSIKESLKQGNPDAALEAFGDSKNDAEVQNNSWDLIPVICTFLTTHQRERDLKTFDCCKELIGIVARKSNPEEALLQFIEEIEECKDDAKFLVLLKPLTRTMCRIPSKRLNSLAWSFNAIQAYLNKCEVPGDMNLVGKEKLLFDTNEDVQRINKLYSELLPFYEYFVNRREDDEERRKIICKFLVQLLGRPLVFLDMEIFDGIKSRARVIAEDLVCKVFKVNSDPYSLIEMRFDPGSDELTKPGAVGIASLFYLMCSQGVCFELAPKVYHPVYVFQNCLHLVTALLCENHQISVEKGIGLVTVLLERIDRVKLSYLVLDSKDHCTFCKALSNVIVYNQDETARRDALEVYKTYLDSFETRGFYLVIYNLVSTLRHSGLIGFTITRYKDRLVQQFLNDERDISPYFKGPKLVRVLRQFCCLRENEESDLLELYDQIMATLNLLRYLALRDGNNATQIWDSFPLLEEIYLTPLRKGIELSRAHYELKVKEIKEEPVLGERERSTPESSVSVAGRDLVELSAAEKLKVLYSSLTAFDIMDSLLSRLIECIEAHKF